MILPLADHTYLEVVEVLDHPASDKAPFGQAVRARSALGGGWLGWVVAVDDIAVVEQRLGREAADRQPLPARRHRADWKQIGVNGLISDPQLPFFIEWSIPDSLHPAPAPTATSRWPAWRSPATRSGSASGSARPSRRRWRTSRSTGSRRRHARHHGRPVPDRQRPRPASDRPVGLPPRRTRSRSPNIWHHPATYEVENRAFDPDGRSSVGDARRVRRWAGRDVLDLGCGTGFHLPRFAATAALGHRCRAAPRPGRAGRRRTRALAHVARARRAPPRRSPCPTRPSTSCTCAGPTSSARAPSRACASSTASYAAAARRS